ncbi:formyl-CoA transferase [Amycolatopsis sulphurea]|uniref:Formyl-CoA transferase n=1 Tax=Amycolatopsis sulphurea TaxID=76022 RepID=A0A2A9G295_9PSEU|nr:CaiB/BaiF CoA-transferase family protein [Amycolatopsis sulphurea]PFG56920.1 formyl-CoA transferase [Amycolatopsis sulphurea]
MTNPPGPLSDIRVIEMGQLIAGPFCGQLLGDLGAEVIKIEQPGAGDPMRHWGAKNGNGDSLTWPVIARNKKSITSDLRGARGQEVTRKLLATADILIENFRPGTLERWNLAPERLWRANPALIVVRVSGFGQSGPYAGRAGYGSIGEAMGGLRYLIGEPDRPPARAGVSIGDSLAGTYAALGALAALHTRQTTGRGQVVDSAIYEAVLAMSEAQLTEWEAVGHQRERTGAILSKVAPSNVYPTAKGAEVLIAANQDTVFRRLAAAMGRAQLAADPRYATHDARGEHQAELDHLIADWSRQLDADTVLEVLHEAGVPAGKVYRAEDMFADEHFAARSAITHARNRRGEEFAMQNVAPRLSGTPGSVRWAGPDLGEHTDQILTELGLSTAEIASLRETATI